MNNDADARVGFAFLAFTLVVVMALLAWSRSDIDDLHRRVGQLEVQVKQLEGRR